MIGSGYSRLLGTVGAVCVLGLLAGGAAVTAQQPSNTITFQDLLQGLKDPTRWLTFSGDYSGQRHSPLTQITPENVKHLSPQWTFQTDTPGKFEATPIVLDGVLYVTGANNLAWALDARTGRTIWRYRRDLPDGVVVCCGRVNRGFGILGDTLYMATLDAHLLAMDRKTGAIVWDAVLGDYKAAYSSTSAPLVVKDKVLIGMGGGEYGVRGFIDAYDAKTGKRAWRFHTIPAPGEPGNDSWSKDNDSWATGGGATWQIGSYDPELNLVIWGTGNAGPQMYGGDRPGDNLYAASFVALDADTGKVRWHFQFTPHDVWDYDATHVPVLADIMLNGQRRKVVLNANRNGFFYVLDRETGKMLLGKPFANTTWAKEIGADGRPKVLPNTIPTEKGALVCPAAAGATNFMTPSYDPKLGLLFITAREGCMTFYAWKVDYVAGDSFRGGAGVASEPAGGTYGALRAIDPTTGAQRWEFRYTSPTSAGVTSTASGLVFTGDNEGNFIAFDGRTGKSLWHYQTGSGIYASATTYMLDGKQHIVMPSGATLTAFALPDADVQR
ncbi:MAG: PQQ-dependent dehydrogenase, methanol/ethanol family [Vicinamibacterales bacterium]